MFWYIFKALVGPFYDESTGMNYSAPSPNIVVSIPHTAKHRLHVCSATTATTGPRAAKQKMGNWISEVYLSLKRNKERSTVGMGIEWQRNPIAILEEEKYITNHPIFSNFIKTRVSFFLGMSVCPETCLHVWLSEDVNFETDETNKSHKWKRINNLKKVPMVMW